MVKFFKKNAMTSPKVIRLGFITFIFTLLLLTLFHSSSHINLPSLESHSIKENVPGAYVERKFLPISSNESYCDFNYKLPKDLSFGKNDIEFGPELGKSTQYRILYNAVQARMSGDVPAITYATHVTADFMNYIPELLR